ncbi:hypothetical protein VTP01DRAFT_4781 [Rhizomucor pusillus]|uniref:uncharacterized protein n=1 Tax=Rhizomucor pusillus TaxID=4840 RepID=UPI003743FB2E
MTASFATTVIHKAANNTLLFLMQPCHASAVLLILVMSWPDHKYPMIPHTLFNIYLHTLWGAILALIWPDLRDHDMLGEVSNFFLGKFPCCGPDLLADRTPTVEHTLVLVLPFYLITTKRYTVLPASLDMALLSFFLYAAYHSPMLHVLSLYSGFNLNYVLVPPALQFLIAAGVWYRFIMYMTALVMMFLTRYILVGSWLLLVQRQEKNKKQA